MIFDNFYDMIGCVTMARVVDLTDKKVNIVLLLFLYVLREVCLIRLGGGGA